MVRNLVIGSLPRAASRITKPEKEIYQHQEKMKKPTYIGEIVLPEFERRKIPFGDLISELEWENQPCRKI